MFVFRAINEDDLKDLINNEDIKCSLIRSYFNGSVSSAANYYNLCFNQMRGNALDSIAGHVAGGKVDAGLSCWISTTSDYEFAVTEYALPQCGQYNKSRNRKPVIMIYVDEKELIDDNNKILELRRTMKDDMIVDLRNDKLSEYYNYSILSCAYNPEFPEYDLLKELNRLIGAKISLGGFNNFAKVANEIVFYKQIKKERIITIIYPIIQDIIYSCNIDISKDYKIIDKLTSIVSNIGLYLNKEELEWLYPTTTTSNNLTDILKNNYMFIEGNNIYEKYDYLKNKKRKLLNKIVNIVNNVLETNFTIDRLVDDGLIVFDYNNPIEVGPRMINDVLLVHKDGNLYDYIHRNKTAVFAYGNNIIKKEEIKSLKKK